MAVLCSYRELKCIWATLMQLGFTFFIFFYSLSLSLKWCIFRFLHHSAPLDFLSTGHRWPVGGILGNLMNVVQISGVLCGNEAVCTLHGVSHVLISLQFPSHSPRRLYLENRELRFVPEFNSAISSRLQPPTTFGHGGKNDSQAAADFFFFFSGLTSFYLIFDCYSRASQKSN